MIPVFKCFHTHCFHTSNLELSYCCIQFLLGEGTIMVDITKETISFSTWVSLQLLVNVDFCWRKKIKENHFMCLINWIYCWINFIMQYNNNDWWNNFLFELDLMRDLMLFLVCGWWMYISLAAVLHFKKWNLVKRKYL